MNHGINVAEIDLQRAEEKAPPIHEVLTVLIYRGAPLIYNPRQP